MQLDLNTVGEVLAWGVEQYVSAGHEEQAFVAFEEKAARIRQHPLLFESVDACCGKQKGFDHSSSASF
jgi:hypothetical protein